MTTAKTTNIQPTPSIYVAYFGSFVSYKSTIETSTNAAFLQERNNQFKANNSVANLDLNQSWPGRSAWNKR